VSAPFVPTRPRHGFLVICGDGVDGDAHPRAAWAFRRTADPTPARLAGAGAAHGRVLLAVRIIPTNEALMIARSVVRVLGVA
jgi:hypothetical protein